MEAIQRRKKKLKGDISASEKAIRHHWKDLFHKGRNRATTTAGRLSNVFATSLNVLDGAMLAWKLYKKFRR